MSLEKTIPSAFDEDSIIVERVIAGEPAAFETLYRKFYERIYVIAKGIVSDPDDTDDAVQEIFSLTYRNLAKFDRRSKFSTWIFRVAVNQSIQYTRRLKYRKRTTTLDAAESRVVETKVEIHDERIDLALARLSPADRAVLVLYYWQSQSLTELANVLECNENAAKTRLYRARERFKKYYQEAGR